VCPASRLSSDRHDVSELVEDVRELRRTDVPSRYVVAHITPTGLAMQNCMKCFVLTLSEQAVVPVKYWNGMRFASAFVESLHT
jgi:hypothetical protein